MTNFNPKNPTKYLGTNKYITFFVSRNREPTGADFRQPETGTLYSIATVWQVGKDPITGLEGDLWMLTKIVANIAYWVKLSAGSIGPTIGFNVPFGSSPVFPNGSGLVTLTSTAGTITITGSTNNINFDLSGGMIAVDSFQVDAFTAPGTNPVVPTAGGLVTITGSQVPAGTTTNVIRTDSLAANTYTIEIQRSQAVVSSTIGDNGVSHFNSADFTVDSNGFVSLIGGLGFSSIKNQVFTSSGTYTPTTGMSYCEITIIGGGGAGGGAPTTGAGQLSTGGGGGAGEYATGIFTAASIGASKAVTIGSGGTGVSGMPGNSGGNTSVGVLISAFGGGGGATDGPSSGNTSSDAGTGGTGGSGGDYRSPGFIGIPGFSVNVLAQGLQAGFPPYGANSQLGSGGTENNAGTGYGSGGGGTGNVTSEGAKTGGAGAPGVVIIKEYILA